MSDLNTYIAQLPLPAEPAGLYEPIRYAMASGGKRLRPMLALMAADLFGGKEEDVLPAAMALEMFHNFTLLHDDLMDGAPVRRGRPTVYKQYGDNTAILSGDQMLIEAYRLIAEVPTHTLSRVLPLFTQMATEICEGQQYDMDFEQRSDVTIPEYMTMIRLKTSVLLGTALHIGALIAGASEADQEAIYSFGVNLGLAFQIQDDMLDCWGDPATFGKRVGGDIVDNKKSLAMLLALHNASTDQLARLHEAIAITDEEEKITAVLAIYEEIGVRRMLEAEIADYTQRALSDLGRIALPDERKQPLRAIAEKLSSRQS